MFHSQTVRVKEDGGKTELTARKIKVWRSRDEGMERARERGRG